MSEINTINQATMPTNSQLRQAALDSLRGNWTYPVLCTLLFTAVVSVAGNIPLAGLLVVCPLGFGYCLTFLQMIRGEVEGDTIVTRPFEFFNNYGRVLGTSLLVWLFTLLWSLLFIVPGIVKGLSYAMTPYVMYDNPTMPVRECVRKSQQMMDGYKWKLFCLYLSFIGWILLGCITFGIGLLWVSPYMQASEAKFYQELKERQNFIAR